MPSWQFQHQVPQIWAIQSITCHERLQNLNGGEHLLPNKNRLVNNKMNINIKTLKKYETEKMCQFWHPTSLLNQFWHPTSLLNQFWHPTSLLKQFWHPTSLLNQFWHPTSLLNQFWHQTSLLNQFWLPTSLLKQFWHPTSLLNQFWHPTSLLHQFWHPAFLLMKLVCCVGFLAKQQSLKHVTAFEETVANVQKKNGANLPPHPDMPAECACSQPLH